MSNKILFVDDEPNVLESYKRNLRKQFKVDTALGPEQGLASLALHGPYAVVVADMQMPVMNGIEFLTKVEEGVPDTVRLMLTGNADQKTAMDAVNQGHVFRFLTKPCPPDVLEETLEAALQQYRLVVAEREVLENTLNGAVKVLTDVLSAVDPQSFDRGRQLRGYVETLRQSCKIGEAWELELAAMLAPIGRVTLPATVLMKERSGLTLTAAETDMLARVPEVGAQLLGQIPRLENVARIVRHQHRNFQDSGTLADGEEIPVGARVLKVLNDLAAYESKGASKEAALRQMQSAGGHYDPGILTAACSAFDISLPKADKARTPPLTVRVQDLRPDQVLAEDVKTRDGMLVLVAGSPLSPMLVERLRNFHELGTIANAVLICP